MTKRQTLDVIQEHSSFILAAHESPDADGLGAEYALARALAGLGKRVRVLNSDPTPPKFAFIDSAGIISELTEASLPADVADSVLFILDTNDTLNLGRISELVVPRARACYVIDHHESNLARPAEGWIDLGAAATCEMVFDLVTGLGAPIEADMAAALYAGIVYDTGSFIYQRTTRRTFATALALVDAGASPSAVHSLLNESASVSSLLLMKAALSGMELSGGNRIAVQTLLKDDFTALGARYEEAENLINVPLQVKGIEVSILFKENPEAGLRCSLRSKGLVNVAAIAQHFGGGGHKLAAGFKCARAYVDARREVVELVELLLSGGNVPPPPGAGSADRPRKPA